MTPDDVKPFACVECGQRFAVRVSAGPRMTLERHWRETGHGPKQVQSDSLDRARFSIAGDDAPPPERVDG